MAKETMKEKIARLEAELEHEKKLNDDILKKLYAAENQLLEKNDSDSTLDFENAPYYKQLHQEIEKYKQYFEQYKGLYEKSENKRKKEHDANVSLHEEIQKLKTENEELKQQRERKHNERGAGRKPTITEQEKQDIKNDRAAGMTIKQLAEKYGYSVGTIHKFKN